MNRVKIMRLVSAKTGIAEPVVALVLDQFMEEIVESVSHGSSVVLSRFGTFYSKDFSRGARWDISQQVVVTTAPKRKMKFRASHLVDDRICQIGHELGDL